MEAKLCVLLCHLGKLPEYIDFFIKSASYNSEYKFVIITDQNKISDLPKNVLWHKLDDGELGRRILDKVGVIIDYDIKYKICDFKPAYGELFSDIIGNCEYWSYTDPDVIWGDIKGVVGSDLENGFDVLSARGEYWVSGAFSVYKNTPRVNSLFRKAPKYKEILGSDKVYRFAETCGMWGNDYKYRSIKFYSDCVSMSDVVNLASKKGDIKYINNDIACEYKTKRQWRYGDFEIRFADGKCIVNGEEKVLFHMVFVKLDKLFYIPKFAPLPCNMYITSQGIKSDEYGVGVTMSRLMSRSKAVLNISNHFLVRIASAVRSRFVDA